MLISVYYGSIAAGFGSPGQGEPWSRRHLLVRRHGLDRWMSQAGGEPGSDGDSPIPLRSFSLVRGVVNP